MKFNKNKAAQKAALTLNHMGQKALQLSPEVELAGLLLTSFATDSYYRTEGESLNRLRELLNRVNAEFAAKAAVFARYEFGMRSITHVVAAELASGASGTDWGAKFYERIVRRPDDMLEIMAAYQAAGGKNPTNAMKKGFAKAFDRFDGYQLAKYRGEGKVIKLVDMVNLVRPVPTERNAEALKAMVAGTLRNTDTWEAKMTQAGQTARTEEDKAILKAEAWEALILERKIGYFALLRNLRNILEAVRPEVLDAALELLTDRKLLRQSLVLPFRFLSAYAEIEKLAQPGSFESEKRTIQKVLAAIEKAATLAVDNLPTLEGRTVILSDNSGSMTGDRGGASLVFRMSNTKTSDIANLFALMYWMKAEDTIVGLFGDSLIYPDLKRDGGLFENFKRVDTEKNKCGAATERGIFDMFERLLRERIQVETIVIFSDTQIGNGCNWFDHRGNRGKQFMDLFTQYRKLYPHTMIYSVDLRGYGTTVFDGSVIKIAGWSEKIFDIMSKAATDKDALVNSIRAVSWG